MASFATAPTSTWGIGLKLVRVGLDWLRPSWCWSSRVPSGWRRWYRTRSSRRRWTLSEQDFGCSFCPIVGVFSPVSACRRGQLVILGLEALNIAEVRTVSWFIGLVLPPMVYGNMPALEALGHILMVPIELLEVFEGVLRHVGRVRHLADIGAKRGPLFLFSVPSCLPDPAIEVNRIELVPTEAALVDNLRKLIIDLAEVVQQLSLREVSRRVETNWEPVIFVVCI